MSERRKPEQNGCVDQAGTPAVAVEEGTYCKSGKMCVIKTCKSPDASKIMI